MQHWIVCSGGALIPNWLEAMPQAVLLSREQVLEMPSSEEGIIWLHLAANEDVDTVYPRLNLGSAQQAVLLADAPSQDLIVASLNLGASGCCNTHAAPEVLQQVALVVANGGLWVGQSLLKQLVGSTAKSYGAQAKKAKNEDWSALLSDREQQVARLVAMGSSNREVAEQLSISERTAKAHLTSIFDKLCLRDRLQLSLKINGLTI
jgi:DNA-binding NarL/FixJ family response regulator